MKRFVSLAVIIEIALFFLLFGLMLNVFTYNTATKYVNNKTVTGEITQASGTGLTKQYQVSYQVGENVYSSDFTITGVDLGRKGDKIGLILGTKNETLAVEELVEFEQTIHLMTGYIVLISLILLILSTVLFFVLGKVGIKNNVYTDRLCERKEHV